MASILDITMRGRSEISRVERATRRQMLDAYDVALDAVERELARGEFWIQQAIDAGEPVSVQWLQRQTWYRQLEADIERHMTRFSDDATRILANGQAASLGVALNTGAVIAGLFEGRVNAPAFSRWVSAIQPGSPVRRVVDGYGDRVSDAVRRHMTEGMGTGQGSRTITRRIMQEVGEAATEARISTFTRTESMRAYRGGFADTMAPLQAQGIITGYRWLSARDSRTCLSCLIMDGTEFDEYPEIFHVSCRCVCQPVVRADLVPGGRPRQSGEEWLRNQPEDVQRSIMGNARFEAWKNGTPMGDMVGVRSHPVWGDSVALKPLRDLPGYPQQASRIRSEDDVRLQFMADARVGIDPREMGDDVAAAWEMYKGTGYQGINTYLRGGEPGGAFPVGEIKREIPNLDAGMSRFTLNGDTRVYRGTDFYIGKEPVEWTTLQPGSVITDPAYMSTTFERGVAEQFGFGHQFGEGTVTYGFSITAPRGTHYMPIADMSEAEMVFPRGSKLLVRNVSGQYNKDGMVVLIDADLIPGKVP